MLWASYSLFITCRFSLVSFILIQCISIGIKLVYYIISFYYWKSSFNARLFHCLAYIIQYSDTYSIYKYFSTSTHKCYLLVVVLLPYYLSVSILDTILKCVSGSCIRLYSCNLAFLLGWDSLALRECHFDLLDILFDLR